MKVWGIDPSSKCGLAIWDDDAHISKAHCEVIETPGEYYWFSAQMGRKITKRYKEFGRPDLVVIEQGSESTQGTGINGVIWCWNCIGAIMSVMGAYGVPIAVIHPSTWRKPFYGKGFQCPQKPVMETVVENGRKVRRQVIEKGLPKFSNDWKTAAINKCDDLGVTLPSQKTIAHNAAEAVGIAHSWAHASIIDHEFEAAFIAMRTAWNAKPVRATTGPDLFSGTSAGLIQKRNSREIAA